MLALIIFASTVVATLLVRSAHPGDSFYIFSSGGGSFRGSNPASPPPDEKPITIIQTVLIVGDIVLPSWVAAPTIAPQTTNIKPIKAVHTRKNSGVGEPILVAISVRNQSMYWNSVFFAISIFCLAHSVQKQRALSTILQLPLKQSTFQWILTKA